MLLEKRVLRTADLEIVELVIAEEQLFPVSRLEPDASRLYKLMYCLEFGVGGARRSQFTGNSFRDSAHFVGLPGFVVGRAANKAASVWVANDQAFLFQSLDRFAYRCSADLKSLGQRSLDESLACGEVAHNSAVVFAGHEHITNRVYSEGIDPWKPQTVGIWDYAKARQGGVDVVVENIWAEPAYQPYNVMTKQVVRVLETFYQVLDRNRERMELALSMADVQRIVAARKMAVILGLEAGWDLDGDLQVLRFLHRMGLRTAQFTTYTSTSSYADGGSGPVVWNGVNERGREIVREMNRLGIVIDVSHASEATQRAVIEASVAPVTDSHRGLRHFMNSSGTMSDETLKALAKKGGVIGLHSSGAQISPTYSRWLRGKEMPGNRPLAPLTMASPRDGYTQYMRDLDATVRERWLERYDKPWAEQVPDEAPGPTLDQWVEQVDYVINLVGDDHVAMGFDQSRGGGYFRDFDATKYPDITAALVRKGYSASRIRKILGGNWIRLFSAVEAVSRRPLSR